MYRNSAVTTQPYRSTVIMASHTKTYEGQMQYEILFGGWLISGSIYATFYTGGGATYSDWYFNQVRVKDSNYFIQYDQNSTASTWSTNIYSRFVGCSGNGIGVYDDTKCNKFEIFEIANCTFSKPVYCNTLGKIIDSTFSATSGITFNAVNDIASGVAPYCSGIYNTLISYRCVLKSTSTGKILNIENQTWIKSA